jgi:membrane protease YdiL (CAAX protease family)
VIIVAALNFIIVLLTSIVVGLILFKDFSHIPQTQEEVLYYIAEMPSLYVPRLSCTGIMIYLITLLVVPVLWIKFARRCSLSVIGLKRKKWISNFFTGIMAGVIFYFCWGFLALLLKSLFITASSGNLLNVLPFSYWSNFIVTVLIAPVGESIFYIGLVFIACAKKVGLTFAMLIAAAIYMLMHIDAASASGFPMLIFVGFFLSMCVQIWLYCKKESLLTPIGFHFAYNSIVFLFILRHVMK